MARFEYEHTFIQHLTDGHADANALPFDVKDGLNAWGTDGWEVVHMEAVWERHQGDAGSWPEGLRGYYVTFKRQVDVDGGARQAGTTAEIGAGAAAPIAGEVAGPTVGEMIDLASRALE